MGCADAVELQDYMLLKDLRVELKNSDEEEGDGSFCLCFWLYLTNSGSSLPCAILHQEHEDITSNVPFLLLNEKKEMMLFPVLFLHREASMLTNLNLLPKFPCVSICIDFPMKRWVHVGVQALQNVVRLHVNGKIAGEKSLTPFLENELHDGAKRKLLPRIVGEKYGWHGYVYHAELSPPTLPIKPQYLKNPPLQLSIDSSSAPDIEEDTDGVWSIVGGKASCRRIFSLDVILSDAFGQPVNKDMEVVASLLYADNAAPVEKTNDGEAPLLTSHDGIEYAVCDRPSKLNCGRASFKLKISQIMNYVSGLIQAFLLNDHKFSPTFILLSSKCDNRLFQIRFGVPKTGRCPFLEAFSHPLRCTSRGRNARTAPATMKKLTSGVYLFNGSQFSWLDDGSSEILHNVVREAKPSPSSKRVKLDQNHSLYMINDSLTPKRADQERNSNVCTFSRDGNADGSNLVERPKNHDGSNNGSSNSENCEATKSDLRTMPSYTNQLSDEVVFKYCLGSPLERVLLLKEIAMSVREEQLLKFAEQVSLFSGCSHHMRQIKIAKRLIEEGNEAWGSISMNHHHVLWENLVSSINEHFVKIVCHGNRSLTQQDLELLRRISGSQDLVSRENFEKMWFWLYPIASMLSQDWINSVWSSVFPKWIEGFITKEEAESSLRHPGGFQDPGTFLLRFPTSRSWPHPDAGNLVITYVGSDYIIHHRLLSLDHISSSKETGGKCLQDMLLEEPELSRLGRLFPDSAHARAFIHQAVHFTLVLLPRGGGDDEWG